MASSEKPVLRTPKLPLEGDNRLTVAAGTVVWLVIGIALTPYHHRLDERGHLWWIAAAFVGAGLGAVGLIVLAARDRRLARRAPAGSAAAAATGQPATGQPAAE